MSGTWIGSNSTMVSDARRHLDFDAAVIGLIDGRRPSLDELLAVDGVGADRLGRAMNGQGDSDPVLAGARAHGVAIGAPGESNTVDGHVLMVALPESLLRQRFWWLVLGRESRPFSGDEQQMAEVIVAAWRAAFNRPDERDEGRLLIGGDDRLIHADPITARRVIMQPSMIGDLLGQLHPVAAQRWPNLEDNTVRDLAMALNGDNYWVRFSRDKAVDDARARHWSIELRPLDEGELPVIGLIDDDRIARAIAYIHDRFDSSPNLSTVAQSAHVSAFHFHRMFSKHIGVSPKHYVQAKQLQVAKWLLRSTREPIGHIARQAGFASHGHFTSTFHRVVGISPSDYRDQI